MHRTTIFLDEAMERELRIWAQRDRCTVTSIIREAITRHLAERSTPGLTLGFLGAGRSGRSDIAERHEELLWREPETVGTGGHEADPPSEGPVKRIAGGRRG